MRVADEERIGAAERLGDARDLLRGGFACEAQRMADDCASRRTRPIGPDRIDGILRDGDKFGARRLLEPYDLAWRVQPRIVAELHPGAEILLQPFFRAYRRERHRLDDRKIDLVACTCSV